MWSGTDVGSHKREMVTTDEHRSGAKKIKSVFIRVHLWLNLNSEVKGQRKEVSHLESDT